MNGANDAPTLAAVTGPTYTETVALDHFNAVTGVLTGADVDLPAQTLTFGISGGTVGGSTVLSGVTYDVSVIGTYGTLYLKSTTGAYTFIPNDTAIDALTTTVTENFTFTVSDGTLSANQVVTVILNGTNDAAVIAGVDTRNLTETDTVLTTGGTLTISESRCCDLCDAEQRRGERRLRQVLDRRFRQLDLHRQHGARRVRRRDDLYRHADGRCGGRHDACSDGEHPGHQ